MRAFTSLRRRNDFARVSRHGRRRSAEFLTCLVAAGRHGTRVGITVSRHVGGAVVRNLLRRRLRAILDHYAFAHRPQQDILFIARPGAGSLSFAELRVQVERTFEPAS